MTMSECSFEVFLRRSLNLLYLSTQSAENHFNREKNILLHEHPEVFALKLSV